MWYAYGSVFRPFRSNDVSYRIIDECAKIVQTVERKRWWSVIFFYSSRWHHIELTLLWAVRRSLQTGWFACEIMLLFHVQWYTCSIRAQVYWRWRWRWRWQWRWTWYEIQWGGYMISYLKNETFFNFSVTDLRDCCGRASKSMVAHNFYFYKMWKTIFFSIFSKKTFEKKKRFSKLYPPTCFVQYSTSVIWICTVGYHITHCDVVGELFLCDVVLLPASPSMIRNGSVRYMIWYDDIYCSVKLG